MRRPGTVERKAWLTCAFVLVVWALVLLAAWDGPTGRPCDTDADCVAHCGEDGAACVPAGWIVGGR